MLLKYLSKPKHMPYFSKYNPDCKSKYEDLVDMYKIIKKLLKKNKSAYLSRPGLEPRNMPANYNV